MSKGPVTVNIELSDKQIAIIEALRDPEKREVLYSGGSQKGASFIGCYWIISECLKNNNGQYLIAQQFEKNLKLSTIKTFFKVCDLLQLEEGVHYDYNELLGMVRLNNNIVLFRGTHEDEKDGDKYPRIPNMVLSGAFVDNLEQLRRVQFEVIRRALSHEVEQGTRKLFASFLPSPSHWIDKEFYQPFIKSELSENKEFVEGTYLDNPFIDHEAFVESVKNSGAQPWTVERLVNGSWDYLTKLKTPKKK